MIRDLLGKLTQILVGHHWLFINNQKSLKNIKRSSRVDCREK